MATGDGANLDQTNLFQLTPWRSSHYTDRGEIRKVNEDAYLDWPEMRLWAVADGMGGHDGGVLASHQIVECLRATEEPRNLSDFIEKVRAQLQEANRILRSMLANTGASDVVGSTVVALLAFGEKCACLWAGDSRAYLFRNGEFLQVTRDHSMVDELVRVGSISPEDAARHPQANVVTRAVGGAEALEVDVVTLNTEPKDLFVLCSDGLTKELSDNEIASILADSTPQLACERLLQKALEHGGKDNVTVVITQVAVE